MVSLTALYTVYIVNFFFYKNRLLFYTVICGEHYTQRCWWKLHYFATLGMDVLFTKWKNLYIMMTLYHRRKTLNMQFLAKFNWKNEIYTQLYMAAIINYTFQ